ncbi:hypothetical protein BY996DRAFT_6446686 [Phakopsora pachyrhizi]|nr:hypothetical protein BY996DRAFT_6446686 [Phakopsora pachyrhizi]
MWYEPERRNDIKDSIDIPKEGRQTKGYEPMERKNEGRTLRGYEPKEGRNQRKEGWMDVEITK